MMTTLATTADADLQKAADPRAVPERPSVSLDAFSSVLEAVGDLATTDDADAAYARVARRLGEVAPWDTAAVLFLDATDDELSFRWSEGLPESVAKRWRFGLGQGLVGRVAEQALAEEGAASAGRVVVLDEQSGADEEDCPPLPSLRSELAVPLPGRRQLMGVLSLGSRQSGAFTDEHLHFVSLVARHLGRSIESSCAHERARRLARNLSLLQEAGRDLTSILDRRRLLERISDILGRLIDYQLFSVMVWKEDEQQLETLFSKHHPDVAKPQVLKLGEGLCGSAAALRQPVRVGNVHLDPRYIQCSDERVRSELVVPLVIEDRLLGIVDLESFDYEAFSEEHEQLLQTLASSIAVALENANLYERLREDEQRLDRDLTTAREVQRFLLPRRSPWVPGLQIGVANVPARHLGGDIYDFYSYGRGRTAFAIGDVAGKGTGAALYGSLTVGLLRGGYAGDSQCDPPCVMAYLNDELRQLDVERRFLALGFAVYQSEDRTLELSNAGLPYPWLVRDGEARELEIGGLPLGATHKRDRGSISLRLQTGDFVVFTTDGIDEGRAPGGQPFGTDGVRQLLERCAVSKNDWIAQDLADALIRATDRHLGVGAATDDRTVLVLKVTG